MWTDFFFEYDAALNADRMAVKNQSILWTRPYLIFLFDLLTIVYIFLGDRDEVRGFAIAAYNMGLFKGGQYKVIHLTTQLVRFKATEYHKIGK